jgi:hypothetical protein
MDEAKVLIDLKEGIIELQGPVDFVQHYLELYRPAIKGFRGLPRQAAAAEKAATTPGRRKSAASAKAGRAKTVTGTRAILGSLEAGFFDEPRSTGDIKQQLGEAGFNFTDTNVRGSLKRLVEAGELGATGRGVTLRYHRNSPA